RAIRTAANDRRLRGDGPDDVDPAVGGVADAEWTAASDADHTVEGRRAHRHELRRRFHEGVETRSRRPFRRRGRTRAGDHLRVDEVITLAPDPFLRTRRYPERTPPTPTRTVARQ